MEKTRAEIATACLAVFKKHRDQCSPEYEVACVAMRQHGLSSAQIEVLGQLVQNGPIWDGDVCSKAARDDLLDMGFASRACVKGEQGFTVANYHGWDVFTAGVIPAPRPSVAA